ncbi:hypothetical protein VNO77_07262 [Canavalia gladiata]|uniref:C2H2-type domain-containing protein n=1 Tax=Canavalia gladiata TaxID=3824 RepID=A0AAN9M7G5_CANGL
MEKHKCKLCFRSFSNGRALGGHMRSHMMNLPVPPKPNEFAPVQLSFEAESSSQSPSSSSFEQDKSLSYGLRENPKRNFRFADPEFSFAADTSSVILQDRESETESSKKPTRRRSKRAWKLCETPKNTQVCKQNESASSVSDTTTEEDVAFCLMMLSRDTWRKHDHAEEEEQEQEQQQQEEEDSEESEDLKCSKKSNKVRGRYKCETCDKVFRSYQALGGHRASHKKIKVVSTIDEADPELELERVNNGGASSALVVLQKKIHECPVCFRVFASGQALGGHKRTHIIGSTTVTATATATATVSVRISAKFGDSLIDLNLPAPMDDDGAGDGDVSQFDDSAVSDAEFVKLH